MAKQIGPGITGRMDDYSFYHDRVHGYLVRRTGGVSSKEYQTDERYAAARNASAEFAAVSSASKLIRDAFAPFIDQVKDGTMVNRMNKELVALKQADTRHCRGERRAEAMMTDKDANKFFRIFQFNEQVKVYELLGLRLRSATCDVNPLESTFPEGATHAGLTLVRSVIDFEKRKFETSASRMGLVSRASTPLNPLSSHQQGPSLVIDQLPLMKGTEIVCLQVVFFEERDGDFMQLKGKVHGMGIVGIAHCE